MTAKEDKSLSSRKWGDSKVISTGLPLLGGGGSGGGGACFKAEVCMAFHLELGQIQRRGSAMVRQQRPGDSAPSRWRPVHGL